MTTADTDSCAMLAGSIADLQAPKVLCIDDDPEISRIIKLRLEGYGIAVFRAFNGMQGYWTGLDFRPDVIITDLAMPEGEGNYVMSRFRSHPLTADVPIIILTGQTNPAIKRTMFNLGASAYLVKPLIFEELIGALRTHIQFPLEPNYSCTSTAALREAKLR
jgi:DNA-binding response OmpR family regulator